MTSAPSLSRRPGDATGRVDTAVRYELDANMARGPCRARRARPGAGLAAWVAVPAALAALVACDNLSPAVSGVSAKDDGRGAILVGHFASMTGPEATWGSSTDQGIHLATEERNARGGVKGRPIEVITLDDASKAQ